MDVKGARKAFVRIAQQTRLAIEAADIPDRDRAMGLWCLMDAGEHPLAPHVQRTVRRICQAQAKRNATYKGSWGNGEHWDTAFCVTALYKATERFGGAEAEIQAGLDFLWNHREKIRANWDDEVWGTWCACYAFLTTRESSHPVELKAALDWLATRRCDDGSFVSATYTAMIAIVLTEACAKLEIASNLWLEAAETARKWLVKEAYLNREKYGRIWSHDSWQVGLCLWALCMVPNKEIAQVVKWGVEQLVDDLSSAYQDDASSANLWLQPIGFGLIALTKALNLQIVEHESLTEPPNRWARLKWESTQRNLLRLHFDIMRKSHLVPAGDPTDISFDENTIRPAINGILQKTLRAAMGYRRGSVSSPIAGCLSEVNADIDTELVRLGKKLGRFLSTDLLRRCNKRLFEEKVNFVAVDVPPAYGNLPWELLHDGEDFWCLKYAIGRSITERSTRQVRTRRGQPNCLLVVDPTAQLFGAELEADVLEKALGELFKVTKFGGQNFSEDEFLDLLESGEFDVFHFCGHASNDDHQGFLEFQITANGSFGASARVTASEIAGALKQSPSPPCIAFVNACSSGVTMDEKVAFDNDSFSTTRSLASAFVQSGTSAYIGSLWPIHDASAAEFAKEFYRYVLMGCPFGEAMRVARRVLYHKTNLVRDTWAAYILYGDPSDVLSNEAI